MKAHIKRATRESVYTTLNEFCIMAKEPDFIEVTEWSNGEGFDIEIQTDGPQRFQLTWGQFDALKYLIKNFYNYKKGK